jgi:hypothetical protein
MDWLKKGWIRNNPMQAGGWLVLLGVQEYAGENFDITRPSAIRLCEYGPDGENRYNGWKIGAYEPTDQLHADIEYLYTIDLAERTLTIQDAWTLEELNHPGVPVS